MQAQPHHTSWRNIALAIFAALNAAFQIGKAIIALPLLQVEAQLLIAQAGQYLAPIGARVADARRGDATAA